VAIIVLATIVGLALDFTSIDPIRALFWSAVINGVTAVPIMVLMMLMASNPKVMCTFVTPMPLRMLGWLSTGVMAAAVIAKFVFI
jgi:Mn2+/Fe2+ NRAMP family transporter